MSYVGSIVSTLPSCCQAAHPQTKASIGLRVTSVVLGVLLAVIGALVLKEIGGLGHIGAPAGWVMVGLSIPLILAPLFIQGVNKKLDVVEKFQVTDLKGRPIPQISKEKTIENGRGDFVLISKSGREITEELYLQAYPILEKYSVTAFSDPNRISSYANRHLAIEAEVQAIDKDLTTVFVPTTLMELVYIHAAIEEDIEAGEICSLLQYGPGKKNQRFREEERREADEEKCWHLCAFDDQGDNFHPDVQHLAFRLNRRVVESLPTHTNLTYGQITDLMEKEVSYLIDYHQRCQRHEVKNARGDELANCTYPGPTTCFGYESTRSAIRPMGLRNDHDANILRNVVALECSDYALEHVFLFRGAKFQDDKPYLTRDHTKPYSLSFGFTLFSGVNNDAEACCGYYTRDDRLDAFAIMVPITSMLQGPFYIPPSNTLCGLLGRGEIFHARSGVWEGIEERPYGIKQGEMRWEFLKTDLPREEFLRQIEKAYNEDVFFLK